MFNGFVQELVGNLVDDLAVELLAKEALEFLGQDVAQCQPFHRGQLRPSLTGDLALLLAAEQLLVLAEHAVKGVEVDLSAALPLCIGDLLGGGGQHRGGPLGLLESLQQVLGQLGG